MDGDEKEGIVDSMTIPGMHERNLEMFSRTEPWARIGWGRRVLRVCRIAFGCVLASLLLLMAGLAGCAIFSAVPIDQKIVYAFTAVCVTVLAWAVGCMYIWRRVHGVMPPDAGGSPPPEPPPEGAPRTAPLRPISPLILFAHADLPKECEG